jgi:FkbM family methyltransferase
MTNIIKKGITKSRDKVLGSIIYSINQLNSKVDTLNSELKAQHNTDMELHQRQQAILNEISQKMMNSGTIKISETEIITKIFSGLKMYLDPRDIAVAVHIALDNSWEYLITLAWLKLVQPNSVILDVGANFGYFGAIAAQKTDKKKSKIVFFEANPKLIPYIDKTLSVNWLQEQSVIENLAIADKEGKLTLKVLKDFIGSSSLHTIDHVDKYMHNKMYLKTEEEVLVQATTIDAYCKKNRIQTVDLIKMDIEGFEEKAYKGMTKTVKSSPNLTFFIEFTKDSYEKPEEFYNLMLQDFGNIYLIDSDGNFAKPKIKSYRTVIGDIDDWVMLVFSKNSKLDDRN